MRAALKALSYPDIDIRKTYPIERALRTAAKLDPGLAEVTVFSAPGAVEVYRHWGFVETGPETEADGIRFFPMRLPL